jgi:hypothetical protein
VKASAAQKPIDLGSMLKPVWIEDLRHWRRGKIVRWLEKARVRAEW